jgi:hypothetical protein
VDENFDPVAHNRAAWDREVGNDNEADATSRYMPGYFATRAIRPGS